MSFVRLLVTLLGPVTWVSFVIAIFWHRRRLNHERKVFLTAIDRRATDLWAGLVGGVGVAIIVTLIAIAGGFLLPLPVLATLTGLSLIALVLAGLGFSPWWLSLAGGLTLLIPWPQSLPALAGWGWRLGVLVAVLWLVEALLLAVIDPPLDVPTLTMGKRGAKIAVYAHRQFYWLPLILPISGDQLAALPWWPTLTIADTRFALIGLPLVLGVALTTKKQLPKTALRRWAWQYLIAGGLALVLAAGSWWRPQGAWLWALAGLGLALAAANRWATRGGDNYISQTQTGVRLVAVQPETPAAKMGLQAGDVVLLCNSLPVHNDAELYAAIQVHPTYCRLRVAGLDGEIRMCETAIYEGAPHELGMITFAEEAE